MPQKYKKNSRGSTSRRTRISTTKVPFHTINTVTCVANVFAQVVGPYSGLSDRLSSMADVFDEYRVAAMKYRLRYDNTTANATGSVAFYPGITTTPPNTLSMIGENPYVSARVPDDDTPTPYVRVPRGILAGEQPWYKCQKGTLTADDSVPGQLLFVSAVATDALVFEADGIVEFRGEADPGNTPLDPKHLTRKIDLLNRRVMIFNQCVTSERDKLLKLLNYTEKSVTIPQITRWPPSTK
jgi:hypothetical protein